MSLILYVHAYSPLHPGTGQSLGAVDQAVARDKATGIPYLPGSSLKGALRAKAAQDAKLRDLVVRVFGPDTREAEKSSGSAVFGDANLLFLPVRCEQGLFAFATTQFILERALRDISPGTQSRLDGIGDRVLNKGKVSLHDLGEMAGTAPPELSRVLTNMPEALRTEVLPRAVVVAESSFQLIMEQGMDLVTRVRIDSETNTASAGGLWLEENLPTETVLSARVGAQRDPATIDDTLTRLSAGVTYLGGHVTIGRGRTQIHVGAGA